MSYHARPTSLGSVTSVINAAAAIAEDPCLADVASLVLRLHTATAPKVPAPATAAPAAPPKPSLLSVITGTPPAPAVPMVTPPPAVGIGLCKTVKPLQAYVWAREHPWIAPLGVAAVVGGIFLIGYATGSGGRR